jgi:hypothetical protein
MVRDRRDQRGAVLQGKGHSRLQCSRRKRRSRRRGTHLKEKIRALLEVLCQEGLSKTVKTLTRIAGIPNEFEPGRSVIQTQVLPQQHLLGLSMC